MSTTPERMKEIATRFAANYSGAADEPDFSDLFADVAKFWTCYGDDQDTTGEGLAYSVQYSTRAYPDRMFIEDVRVGVAEDCFVVRSVTRMADPDDPNDVVIAPQCWVLDVEDGKITRLNNYRDKGAYEEIHTRMYKDGAGMRNIQKMTDEVGPAVLSNNSSSGAHVPAELDA